MGSLLEPAEIRYTIISLVALTVMSGMLAFMGISGTGGGQFQADNASVTNETGDTVDPSDPSTYDSWEASGDLLTDTWYGFFGSMLEFVTDAIAYPFTLMNQWGTMVANAGWASIFIIIPSIVMLLVVVNAMYKIAKAIPYT